MSASAVAPIWAISETANNALSISKGMLAAATSDNIQIIALLACEGFGATLSMCPESCAKAHQLCSKSHESTVLKFLKSQIGYLKGDSGWQLSQSQAGLRFLALAACLLTIDWWRAAETLRHLITESAADQKLIPTSHQIKQLLEAVNYRLARSGFADNIVGWKIWLENALPNVPVKITTPSSETLVRLIQALSKLERLGEAHSVTITSNIAEGVWIIAFIKWCLGVPPTVILPSNKNHLHQQDSRVTLYLLELKGKSTKKRSILIKNVIGSINELHNDLPHGSGDFRGLVRFPKLALRLMQSLGDSDSLAHRAGREAISFSCRPVLDRFRCNEFSEIPPTLDIACDEGKVFPDEQFIASTLADFLGQPSTLQLKRLPAGLLVRDLPSMVAVKKEMENICSCIKCQNTPRTIKKICLFEDYMRRISHCVATVFLASLLLPADPDGVYVMFPVSAPNCMDNFSSAVYDCMEGTGAACCDATIVSHEVCKLIGHRDEFNLDSTSWIMSSHHGQTIYPEILSTLTLKQNGLLNMICCPGIIMHEKEKYSLVKDAIEFYHNIPSFNPSLEDEDENDKKSLARAAMDEGPASVTTPSNQFGDSRIAWYVYKREASLILSIAAPDLSGLVNANPMSAIWTAARSYFVTCNHDHSAPFTENPPSLVPENLIKSARFRRLTGEEIGVVLTDLNENMRFFTLCTGDPCIIRNDACLACCVRACSLLKLDIIVC